MIEKLDPIPLAKTYEQSNMENECTHHLLNQWTSYSLESKVKNKSFSIQTSISRHNIYSFKQPNAQKHQKHYEKP